MCGDSQMRFQVVHQTAQGPLQKDPWSGMSPSPYPIKHKLRDYTMMKNFMSSRAPPGGDELERDSRSRGTMLKEVEVTTIAD
jgi:hypothetical protein